MSIGSEISGDGFGIYKIYWKEGGTSVASVFINQAGDRVLAPANWTSTAKLEGCVHMIKSMVKIDIEEQNEGSRPIDPKRMQLLQMKLEILKLQADDYNWQCSIPKRVREELVAMLEELDKELKDALKRGEDK